MKNIFRVFVLVLVFAFAFATVAVKNSDAKSKKVNLKMEVILYNANDCIGTECSIISKNIQPGYIIYPVVRFKDFKKLNIPFRKIKGKRMTITCSMRGMTNYKKTYSDTVYNLNSQIDTDEFISFGLIGLENENLKKISLKIRARIKGIQCKQNVYKKTIKLLK
ncbi:MAG: hypothetical protein COU40_01435 [Candidatus Moranbacteria bacterium CG10_big_fil_rev_8_21_14_0_10_35_21]|nr:MAG: hypothetical protein COU40_01435 [Candidatus Moranbacteria bacterium CG10_big_fil_rev_8_21_14_0_10_35_21]PJA88572.1 MAG: hypothetical protein CO139_02435 [Candidatus Moranbacteria bacterium CG_4_9_14_3_um_filter_36_9]